MKDSNVQQQQQKCSFQSEAKEISNHFHKILITYCKDGQGKGMNRKAKSQKRKLYGSQFTKPTSIISSTNNAREDIKKPLQDGLLLQLLQDQCHNARHPHHHQLINKNMQNMGINFIQKTV